MATKRAKEIETALKGKSGQQSLDYLVDEMVAKRPVLASFIREGIDRLGLAKNVLTLDGEFNKVYQKFKIAYIWLC